MHIHSCLTPIIVVCVLESFLLLFSQAVLKKYLTSEIHLYIYLLFKIIYLFISIIF